MITNNAREISEFIQKVISDWHTENADRSEDYVVVTEEMKAIRPLNVHRNDIEDVLHDLVITNTEMWHVQDKRLSSDNDDVIARATRDSNTSTKSMLKKRKIKRRKINGNNRQFN